MGLGKNFAQLCRSEQRVKLAHMFSEDEVGALQRNEHELELD